MKYAKFLQAGDTIGVCAPSSGVKERFLPRLDKAFSNVRALGYQTLETASVRRDFKCVSADAKTRADELMALYENPGVAAIIPPWGGELLMEMLPFLDLTRLSELPPKWICGYSDISTLTFVLTVCCNVAAIHGSNFINMGYAAIHESDLKVFEAMSKPETIQYSSDKWGKFASWNDTAQFAYDLTETTVWKALDRKNRHTFGERMIGGCLDVLCKLLATQFAPVPAFLDKYKDDGFIWTLESAEMNAADIYRTLWQMRECGWFQYCKGILFGRPDGYSDTRGFTLTDALESGLGCLDVPVIYDADIGHIPPQIQIINGAFGKIDFNEGKAIVRQEMSV